MITALYVVNVVFFTFITSIWSTRGVNLIVKVVAGGLVVANLAALAVHLGFVVKV